MIPLFKVHVPAEADAPLLETLHSGYLAQGPRVEEFEAALRERLAAPVLTVNSGTAAIVLALRLAGVAPGDAVVTTPMTCTATNLPILAAGAEPVWADVDARSGLIDPDSVRRLLERPYPLGSYPGYVRAVLCVDWGGMPCALDELRAIAWNHKALLIEDAAHALGAVHGGRPVGSVADFTCFSFQAIKHITTGDGGALACLNPEHDRRGRLLRWYGIDRDAPAAGDSRIDVDIEEWGYKAHMNDLAAALGLAQLPHLDRILAAQRANAMFYRANLPPHFETPVEGRPDDRSAWWLFTVLLPPEERDPFKAFMARKGVHVSQVHKRNDAYSVFEPYAAAPGSLPGLDAFSASMVCIPVHWGLADRDREAVVGACWEFARAGRS